MDRKYFMVRLGWSSGWAKRKSERDGTQTKGGGRDGEDREWVLDETWPEEGAEFNCGDEGTDGEWPAWSALVEGDAGEVVVASRPAVLEDGWHRLRKYQESVARGNDSCRVPGQLLAKFLQRIRDCEFQGSEKLVPRPSVTIGARKRM